MSSLPLPPPHEPFVNLQTGTVNEVWYRYLSQGNTAVNSALVSPVAIADGGTASTTASAGFAALKQDATSSTTGVVELATSSEVATGTDTGRVSPINNMGFHPGAAKALGEVSISAGSPTLDFNYGVNSVTSTATVGLHTIGLAVTFASSHYVTVVTPTQASGQRMCGVSVKETTSFNVQFVDDTGSAANPGGFQFAVFGTLA